MAPGEKILAPALIRWVLDWAYWLGSGLLWALVWIPFEGPPFL